MTFLVGNGKAPPEVWKLEKRGLTLQNPKGKRDGWEQMRCINQLECVDQIWTLIQTVKYIYENQGNLITVVYEIILRSYYYFLDVIIALWLWVSFTIIF